MLGVVEVLSHDIGPGCLTSLGLSSLHDTPGSVAIEHHGNLFNGEVLGFGESEVDQDDEADEDGNVDAVARSKLGTTTTQESDRTRITTYYFQWMASRAIGLTQRLTDMPNVCEKTKIAWLLVRSE